MNKLALYCRIGFEKEVAAEITDRASERGVFGFARVVENSVMLFLNAISQAMRIA